MNDFIRNIDRDIVRKKQLLGLIIYNLDNNEKRLGKDYIGESDFFSEELNKIVRKYNRIFNDYYYFDEYTEEELNEVINEYKEEVKNERKHNNI